MQPFPFDDHHGCPVRLTGRALRQPVEHTAERFCLVKGPDGINETAGGGKLRLMRVDARAVDSLSLRALDVGLLDRELRAGDLFRLRLSRASRLLELGVGPLDLGARDATRLFDLRFELPASLVELSRHLPAHFVQLRLYRVPGLIELLFRGAADLFELLLETLPQLGYLRLGLTPGFGGTMVRRGHRRAMTLFASDAHQILRETAEVSLEVFAQISKRALEHMTDLLIEGHRRLPARLNGMECAGLRALYGQAPKC